jgi:hypothetical protein
MLPIGRTLFPRMDVEAGTRRHRGRQLMKTLGQGQASTSKQRHVGSIPITRSHPKPPL